MHSPAVDIVHSTLPFPHAGLTVFQTNYSDVNDDADCISVAAMLVKYDGFLGPRCGVTER
jgi:hypothetical protein